MASGTVTQMLGAVPQDSFSGMLLVGALPCAVSLVGMKLVGMDAGMGRMLGWDACWDGTHAGMSVFGIWGSSGLGYILASPGEPGSEAALPRTSGQPQDAQAPRVPA